VNFGNRDLWKRAWIVQEIAYGQDVTFLCGHKTISFDTMLIASNAWEYIYSSYLAHSFSVGHLYLKVEATPMISILELIRDPEASRSNRSKASIRWMSKDFESKSRLFMATDPRDKVYSFKWILDTDLATSIVPRLLMDVSDVFCTFAKGLILYQQELGCVSDAAQEKRKL
jgi:hypothetical protein